MLYEFARDRCHFGLCPADAANEYTALLASDGGLAAGFRVGYRRRVGASSAEYAAFRRFVRLTEGA